jgi:hypothetical protein
MSMLRVTSTALATAALTLALGGCGGADEVARDEPTSTGSPTSGPAPTSAPDDGGFAPTSYSYTLQVSCYCPYAAVPVRVTVEGDTVVDAVFERGGGRGGAVRGEQAPELLRLSIEDVLAQAEEAEEADAHEVTVEGPEDSEHPTEVYIDRNELAVDEEVGYALSELEVVA